MTDGSVLVCGLWFLRKIRQHPCASLPGLMRCKTGRMIHHNMGTFGVDIKTHNPTTLADILRVRGVLWGETGRGSRHWVGSKSQKIQKETTKRSTYFGLLIRKKSGF